MKSFSIEVSRQAGRTMIELIIAMAIGLVIMAGVGALYISSSGVSRVAQQAGTAQDLGRLAMFMIGEGIKAAGYGEIVGTDTAARDQTLFDGPAVRGCAGSRFTDPLNDDFSCTGVAPGDQVMVRFQGDYQLVDAGDPAAVALADCLGGTNNQEATVGGLTVRPGLGATRRIVRNIFNLNPAGTRLMCTGNSNPLGIPAQLILNVIDFQVFYRFDQAGFDFELTSGERRYSPLGSTVLNATSINALAGPLDPWLHVVGVIVCITIGSAEAGTSLQSANPNATRCPRTEAEAADGTTFTENSTDGRLRRTFMQVFNIRTQGTPSPAVEFM
jgi:prepilin-type N-terminal cleavage/methylation domain-containing protein